MITNGLFLMAIGFTMIMMSPADHNISKIRLGILTLGIAFVLVGFYFYHRGRKIEKNKPKDETKAGEIASVKADSKAKKVTKK